MKNIFKSTDIMGPALHFNINGEQKLTSRLGIIISLSVYSLILTAVIFFGKEIWEKNNPSVNLSNEIEENPLGVSVDFKNFDIFFGIRNKANKFFIDQRIYTVKASLYSLAKNESSTFFISRDLKVEPCKANSFEEGSVMRKFDNSGGWCVSRNQSFDLSEISVKGLFGKESFQQIRVLFYECKNSKEKNSLPSNSVDANNNSNFFFIHSTQQNCIININYDKLIIR